MSFELRVRKSGSDGEALAVGEGMRLCLSRRLQPCHGLYASRAGIGKVHDFNLLKTHLVLIEATTRPTW